MVDRLLYSLKCSAWVGVLLGWRDDITHHVEFCGHHLLFIWSVHVFIHGWEPTHLLIRVSTSVLFTIYWVHSYYVWFSHCLCYVWNGYLPQHFESTEWSLLWINEEISNTTVVVLNKVQIIFLEIVRLVWKTNQNLKG